MKIATYNVWYPNIGIRAKQLIETINSTDADIIGLQEVTPGFYNERVAGINYPHHFYISYCDDCGLALLSKYPFVKQHSLYGNQELSSIAHSVIVEIEGVRFSVTNVHLPWDSVLAKETQIVAINKFIHTQKDSAHFFILLGDFNSTLSSSVHHFLLGEQSLLGCEANPYWNDLASVHAELNGYHVAPTLDFVNNPRWKGKNTNYVPDVCDRIYIMESFCWDNEFRLLDVAVFGKEVSPETGYAPSDHYGVLAEVEFIVKAEK